MKLLGICGKARSGKNTVGEVLWQEFDFDQYAFADHLKRIASRISLNSVDFWDDNIKDSPILNGKTPREFLQQLGTDWVKPFLGEDIWVKHLIYDIKHTGFPWPIENIVITDVRFEEEAEWIKSVEGTIVEVLRLNNPSISGEGHSSENGIPHKYIDHQILNMGLSVEDFKEHLKNEKLPEIIRGLKDVEI